MTTRMTLVAGLLALGLIQPVAAQQRHEKPDAARLVTSDVKLFFNLLDTLRTARTLRDSATLVFERYYLPGSVGLRDFIGVRLGSVYNVIDALRAHPQYYAHLRASLRDLDARLARIPSHFSVFERLYPDAVFADTYFIVGAANTGGTIANNRLLIGAEMYGRDAAAPAHELNAWQKSVLRDLANIDAIVVHELVHVNQWTVGRGMLRQALIEGGADFLGELVSGVNVNADVHAWANPREAELWKEFQEDLRHNDPTRWLYNGGDTTRGERPADLGYWMGYRIVKRYYETAPNKVQAIRDILDLWDPEDFLRKSGYAPR